MATTKQKRIYNLISTLKESERGNLFIFLVIFFGIGIGAYFSISFEPNYSRTLIGLGISILVLIFSALSRHRKFYPAIFLSVFALGFFTANTKAILSEAPKIKDDIGTIWLRGKLEDIDKKDNYYRFIVSHVDLWQPKKGHFHKNETPKKIRLNIRTEIAENVNEGDIIKARVKLSKPTSLPVYPNGYDFAKYAYFEGIGAVGYSVNKVEVFKEKETGILKNIRNRINQNISDKIKNKDNAEILKALITAERGGINKDIKETIRNAGLGHVLAISGMHMSIACIWFFTIIRLIMACFPAFSLKYDTKKIASVMALGLGFFYLMITELPVSATRSFIMIALFLVAILIDRTNQPLRPIAMAGFGILLFQPESLVTPGFQMSFAAVICLIGVYQLIFKNFDQNHEGDRGFIKKFLFYFFGVIATTMIASIATSPYAIYHFGQIPKYSVISNLVAIPALTFITLPALFISVILMPFGAEGLTLWIAEFGVNIIKDIAIYVSGIEGNLISKPAFPSWFLWYSTISMLWLFAFRSKIRYISLPFIIGIYGIILFYNHTPDMVIDGEFKHFALKAENGDFKFYGRKSKGYKISRWAEELGINENDLIFASKEDKQYCSTTFCDNGFIKLTRRFNKADCINYKFIIINGYQNGLCNKGEAKVFNKYYLQNSGTLTLYKNGDFTSSRIESGRRIWNK